jgi:hypothetical protein
MGIWHSRQTTSLPGTDFIVARNGRIASVYLFFDNLPYSEMRHLRIRAHILAPDPNRTAP